MEKVAGEEGTEQEPESEAIEPQRQENGKRMVLEEISYCLSMAKRLVDIELGRISK